MPSRRPPPTGALTDLEPLRILAQIALLQAAYYACATCLIFFTALVAGNQFTPDLILSWRSLRGDTTVGWMLGLIWMLNSLIEVIFILLLVARSKLVLDFAFTVHVVHLLITSLYTHSIPTYWLWWALQGASVALMTSLGIWSCQWRELQPIHFGTRASASQRVPGSANPHRDGTNVNKEISIGRELIQENHRDGIESHELLGMKLEPGRRL